MRTNAGSRAADDDDIIGEAGEAGARRGHWTTRAEWVGTAAPAAVAALLVCGCVQPAQIPVSEWPVVEADDEDSEGLTRLLATVDSAEKRALVPSVEPRIATAPDLQQQLTGCQVDADVLQTVVQGFGAGAELPPFVHEMAAANKRCFEQYWQAWAAELLKRYAAADVEAVVLEAKRKGGDAEMVGWRTHNAAVGRWAEAQRKRIRAEHEQQVERLRQAREAARAREVAEEAAERRRRNAAIAGAIKAFADGFSAGARRAAVAPAGGPVYSAPATGVGYSAPTIQAGGCSSDFQCGLGGICVKPNFSSRGYCAKGVDSMGVPTYRMPRIDSVGPKMPSPADCRFDTDCPIGFRCDARSGACIK